MNNQIQIFENAELGLRIRVLSNKQGEPLFVANELAMGLGYSSASALTRTLDDDEKGMQIMHTHGGNQQMTVITESGFYHAALKSRVPQAKVFRKWVTSEVLPSIRRDGGYILATPEMTEEEIMARAVVLGQRRIEALQHQLAMQAPKVEFADALTASSDAILIRDMAKLITQNGFEIGEKRLYQWMRDHEYLTKNNRPMQRYMEMGLFQISVTLVATNHGSVEKITPKVTGKGQEYFVRKFVATV